MGLLYGKKVFSYLMKILFDSQIFNMQSYGGISRYFCELFNNFNSETNFELAIKTTANKYIIESKQFKNIKAIPSFSEWLGLSDFKGKFKLYNYFYTRKNISESVKILKNQDFDIFHPTYYNPYFLKHIGNKPFVLTVYDTIHEIFPQYFPYNKIEPMYEWKKDLLEKAAQIIAISTNTKNDLIKIFGVDKNKINVIYLANSISDNKTHIDGIPAAYILFTGQRGLYKNFINFIRAVSELLKKDKNLYVVCAGGGSFNRSEKELLASLSISNNVIYTSAHDTELAGLYSNALAFVFPSLYEGFGLPILEAFACKTPVILSNASSFPEVALDAAQYFDPKNQESMQNAVALVIYNQKRREELINKGLVRSKFFSWEKTTKETLGVYKKAYKE